MLIAIESVRIRSGDDKSGRSVPEYRVFLPDRVTCKKRVGR